MSARLLAKHFIFLLAPLLGWSAAQLLKPFFKRYMTGVWSWRGFLASGGMPSSHSAGMMALTSAIGVKLGLHSPMFALAMTVSMVVMYDAKGIRQAGGKHAAYLNVLMDNLKAFLQEGFTPLRLKTELGHTGHQVVWGAILGVGVGVLVALFI